MYLSGDDAKYKDYRNKISLLTRLSKKQYFSKYLKGTWGGINNLLNPKKKQSVTISVLKQPNSNSITNIKSRISNIMNERFANIGQNLAKQLPTPEKHFIEFLDKNKSPVSSFLFQPIKPNEVKLEILSMPCNKSYGF